MSIIKNTKKCKNMRTHTRPPSAGIARNRRYAREIRTYAYTHKIRNLDLEAKNAQLILISEK